MKMNEKKKLKNYGKPIFTDSKKGDLRSYRIALDPWTHIMYTWHLI